MYHAAATMGYLPCDKGELHPNTAQGNQVSILKLASPAHGFTVDKRFLGGGR